MHTFTSHRDGTKRYFAHFDLPTHVLCWLRGHRARAEVIDSEFASIDPWILIECRTCAVRHQNPYMSAGKIDASLSREDAQERIAEQVEAARNNNAAYAQVRDGRDGYGHRRVELALELTGRGFRKPGIHLHIGDRWSETPFDGSVHAFGRSAYFSIGGIGNRLAHRLAKGKKADLRIGAGYRDTIEATR